MVSKSGPPQSPALAQFSAVRALGVVLKQEHER
jgi:hypothetical protein